MNIAQAKARLMELANGEYHSIAYEVTDAGEGRVSQNCKVYMHKHGWFEASRWEGALGALEEVITGGSVLSEEMPVTKKKVP